MAWTAVEDFMDVIDRTTATAAECPALRTLGILEVGLTHAGPRWCFVRPAPAFALALVTVAGRGAALVDGAWQTQEPETAYLMPPGALHGYRVAEGAETWRYAWVRLIAADAHPWLFEQGKATVLPAPSYSLQAAIAGLITEVKRGGDQQLAGLWSDLVQASLRHLVRPAAVDPRLARLWTQIEASLDESWDLERMAAQAHLSREHLRRLCRSGYGCSPHQRLAALRLRRACMLLLHSDEGLAGIAERIGFSDGFSFSQAFKREYGVAPSAYRARARRSATASGLA